MFGILHAICHDDIPPQQILCCLEHPKSAEEKRIATQLRAVSEEAAELLRSSIEDLADKQSEQGFYSGVRFGAQLMAELLGRTATPL